MNAARLERGISSRFTVVRFEAEMTFAVDGEGGSGGSDYRAYVGTGAAVPVRRDFAQNEMDFFLDPTESAWNAECIRVHLSDGKVVSKEYLRD